MSLGEFGATLFLARSDLPTLPLVIYRALGQPGELNRGAAYAGSVVLAVVVAVVVLTGDAAAVGTTSSREPRTSTQRATR